MNRLCTRMLANLIVLCGSLWSAADAAEKPNILLIMADDMGYECVQANGSTTYKTPHLDKLAAGGMRFEHCHSQPICTPSRVQIMTGIYNNRNYIRFGILHPEATTFAHLLKQAGYATGIAGKWQLKGGFDGPHKFGFDEYCLWQLTRRPGRYPNPGLEINGKAVDYTNGEYGPDIVSDFLCDFMERMHKQGKPFLAYYPMILPHWPFEPTPDSPEWDPQAKGVLRGHGENKYFDDMVAYTDKMAGKLVAKLNELGIRENTLVLFTGDNGTYTGITSRMGDKQVRGGKGKTLDTGTHVPFIASWPGVIPAGKVNEDLIDFSDFLPTLVEVAGGQLPKEIDGRSFYPQLRGEKGHPREWIYCWYERNGKRNRAKQLCRDQRYKLYSDGKFFDVVADPEEKRPLDANSLDDEQRRAYKKLKPPLDAKVKDPVTRTGPRFSQRK